MLEVLAQADGADLCIVKVIKRVAVLRIAVERRVPQACHRSGLAVRYRLDQGVAFNAKHGPNMVNRKCEVCQSLEVIPVFGDGVDDL